MSWSDVFPVWQDSISEGVPAENLPVVTGSDSWFEVQKIINPQPTRGHLVSTSLFWKRDLEEQERLPEITREMMVNAEVLGLAGRCAPFESYVLPLIEAARILNENRTDTVLRVYLADDLWFLIDELVDAGCEIYHMRSSSICHNPGAMWRFLALEDAESPVTVIDADRAKLVLSDIARTEASFQVGVGGWRVPYDFNSNGFLPSEGYRPINACQFGSSKSYPMRRLMEDFIGDSIRGRLQQKCTLEGLREKEIAGTRWPDYGFDEWFLLTVMYPRMAMEGLLTFYPWDLPSLGQFFALDIEYCTWGNPNSELINYPNPESALGDVIRPWAQWRDETRLNTRPDTAVVKRLRRRIGAMQGIFNHIQSDGIEEIPEHGGDLLTLFARMGDIREKWYVDLNPQLYLNSRGGELFRDRRYEKCDVVFCGYYFIKITPVVAEWAAGNGHDEKQWGEGKLLKVPKLEGPMTMWRTEFSRTFYKELATQVHQVKAEILLRSWMDQGRVVYAETTAKEMGWRVR